MIGNVLALDAITLQTGATLNGRVLTQVGQVALDANVISAPVCFVEEEEEENTIRALPNTGGAPIQNEEFPWSLALVGGLGAIALALGVRAYRRNRLPKQ